MFVEGGCLWMVHLSCFNLFYLADWGEVTFLILQFFFKEQITLALSLRPASTWLP